MAKWLINQSTLTDIADAIREKKGTSGTITVSELADEIASISGGGGGDAEPIAIYYGFNNNTSASADGNIVLVVNDSTYNGSYDIRWANADGVMTNYSPIDTLAVTTQKLGYIKMNSYKGIPKYATKIVACAVNSNNSVVATFNIPSAKLWNTDSYGEHRYSVGIFSDIHGDAGDWSQAFTFFNTLTGRDSIVAMCGSGDLSSTGIESEMESWKTFRDTYRGNVPVYTCNGNHEAKSTAGMMKFHPELMRQYLDSDETTSTDCYFWKEIGTEGHKDIFFFMPNFEGASEHISSTMFSADALSALESVLESHRNQRVFIFSHCPPHPWYVNVGFGTAYGAYDNDRWGAKDDGTNYPKADRTAFQELLMHYKNAIWFTGHSHIKYKYDKDYENLNICRWRERESETVVNYGATLIHISSLSKPRDVIAEGLTNYDIEKSEGAILDVYDNVIRMRCREFSDGVFMGFNEYLIDTTPIDIPSSTKTLTSISATKTKTSYYTDETFSTADVTVTATYDDSSTANVTASASIGTVDITTTGTKTLSISYTENEVTKTTTISISVSERPSVKTLSSISATKTKTTYEQNETFSTSDVVVTAHYSDSTTATVTTSATIGTVDTSTAGNKTLNISYSEDGVTKTTTIAITVTAVASFLTRGINLDTNTGLPSSTPNNNYAASDFIPVTGTKITYGVTLADAIVGSYPKVTPLCYDSSQNFIGKLTEGTAGATTLKSLTSGTSYVRLRVSLSGLSDAQYAMLNENTVIHTFS